MNYDADMIRRLGVLLLALVGLILVIWSPSLAVAPSGQELSVHNYFFFILAALLGISLLVLSYNLSKRTRRKP